MAELISEAVFTRNEISENILARFPETDKDAVKVFLMDCVNPVYCNYKPKKVVVDKNGVWSFAAWVES